MDRGRLLIESNFHWIDSNTLYSNLFQDIYWSKQGGLLEKEHVFFSANQILERWNHKKTFTIFEFGFGGGLNFFLIWKKVRELNPIAKIQFFSVEKYPISYSEMETLIKNQEGLQFIQSDFLDFYKNVSSGYNSFTTENQKLELVFIFSDIAEILKSFHAKIDVWYLDGFSPAKNPEMWTKEIFAFMKKNSKATASFSTYTTARVVRDGLTEVGFSITQLPGFGNKKFMLYGIIPINSQKIQDKPWFRIPKSNYSKKEAVIIGAGLAGCSLAFALSQKGYSVTMVERSVIASGASGNPAGMFSPLLTGEVSELSEWSFAAYKEFALFLKIHSEKFPGMFYETGVFQILESSDELNLLKKAFENSNLKKEDVKVFSQENEIVNGFSGFFFPNSGWVNPKKLCNAYLDLAKPRMNHILTSSVIELEKLNSHWKISLENKQTLESEIVILSNSFEVRQFVGDIEQLKKVRGQILYYPSYLYPIQSNSVILYNDGYMIPNVEGIHIIGATFDPNDSSELLNVNQNIHLLKKLNRIFPDVNPSQGIDLEGRVSFRAMTNDHLPLVGLVPNTFEFEKEYKDLWKSNIYKDYKDGEYLEGLWVSSGHGSRGILNSYLAANIISSLIAGETPDIHPNLLEKVNPSRFLIRKLINQS